MNLDVVTIRILPAVRDSIVEHSQKEAAKGSYEAVGFVAKKKGREAGVATIRFNNHSPEPQQGFFVEPWEQYAAEQKLAENDMSVMAIYHSHVNSEPLPSATDHAWAWEDAYVLIYSVVFDDLRAYHKVENYLEPVELVIRKGGLE